VYTRTFGGFGQVTSKGEERIWEEQMERKQSKAERCGSRSTFDNSSLKNLEHRSHPLIIEMHVTDVTLR
jgi:hypothetical protein